MSEIKWATLGDIGEIYGGLSGKTKIHFENGNKRYISYKNVFANLSADLNSNDFVTIFDDEKQRKLQKGDVIFTGSSENFEEVGLSSVITKEPSEDIYLNSFCFFFRANDENLLNPEFSKHLFRCSFVREQIVKMAQGVTRINLSKIAMKKLKIPIPSLKTQEQIVGILDNASEKFGEILALLDSEIVARNKQYSYALEKLLSDEYLNSHGGFSLSPLADVCEFKRGKRVTKKDLQEKSSEFCFAVYQNSLKPLGFYNKNNCEKNVACLVSAGSAGEIFHTEEKVWIADDVWMIKSEVLNSKFLFYCLQNIQEFIKSKVRRASVPRISRDDVEKMQIKIPPLKTQEQIVRILDALADSKSGLIELLESEKRARIKQLEYLKDKLLGFSDD